MHKTANMIYEWIASHPSHTELEIASGVGLKKTPYTRWILLSLVQEGYIVRQWDEDRQPRAFIYYCNDTVPMNLQ